MKIMCQEHYDEVVCYAERIGDKTLEERLNVRDVTANRESAAGKFIREMRILI